MALLYSKKSVTSHLQRIKARRADIPNPEIPVRISLSLEKVPELIRGKQLPFILRIIIQILDLWLSPMVFIIRYHFKPNIITLFDRN